MISQKCVAILSIDLHPEAITPKNLSSTQCYPIRNRDYANKHRFLAWRQKDSHFLIIDTILLPDQTTIELIYKNLIKTTQIYFSPLVATAAIYAWPNICLGPKR